LFTEIEMDLFWERQPHKKHPVPQIEIK